LLFVPITLRQNAMRNAIQRRFHSAAVWAALEAR
jgi:hypothetical protein